MADGQLFASSGRCILSRGKGEQLLHAWYKHRVRDEYAERGGRVAQPAWDAALECFM